MEPYLAQLLMNNDPPPEEAMSEVRRMILTPMLELAETNLEIRRLEIRLKSLSEKRDTIQKSIDEYRNILSPVRRLPADILHEIFYHCLPAHRNPILSSLEAPILLTRVCSRWRSTALASPRLWAQLHITFCDDYRIMNLNPPPGGTGELIDYTAHLRPRALRALQQRCEVVTDWLTRSGTCLLSLSISYSSRAWTIADMQSGEGDLTHELFKTVLPFSHRWRTLELTMPIEIYRKLESMISISADTLPALTGLKVSFHEQIPDATMTPHALTEPIALFKAPHLERVSLSGHLAQSVLWGFNNIPSAAWVQQLTYLCCHVSFAVDDAFNMLKQCGNLVHCKLYIMPDYAVNQAAQNPSDTIWTLGIAYLPHLRSLSILEDSTNYGLMVHFYSSIDAPRLKWIDYQKHLYSGNEVVDNTVPSPIFSLLEKSTELKKLTIEPRGLSVVNLQKALGIVSRSLTHLVIGQEPLGPARSLTRHRNSRTASREPFDLEWLLVQDQESELDSNFANLVDSGKTLLPHLEILESSLGVVSDNIVVRFITGRMDPSSPSGIAVLKQVRIMFDRTKEMDVEGEVARYREAKRAASGVQLGEIKLNLDYLLRPRTKEIEPVSSSYGLTKDGRSWFYPDIDESTVPE